MKNSNLFQRTFLFILSAIFLIAAYAVNLNNEKPLMFVSKQDQTINFNTSLFTYFNLGLKRLISSTLWVSTIIESDVDHYKNKDLNSWMFLRFNSISILEPLFYENYAFGGPYLSIVKDDLSGASFIYNKGLAKYPEDFDLLKDAGFHFHFEVGDYQKSYEIYSKLKKHLKANPAMLATLARLEVNQGNSDAAFEILSTKLHSLPDQNSFLAIKLKSHLYALKAEKDLECLNRRQADTASCSMRDFFDEPYILKDKIYSAKQSWVPFKIKK